MDVVIYLLLGLAAMGGLFWLLTQVTARQQRLNAELTRLERLAADVAMSAEAVLEQVDLRTEQLQKLAAQAEERLAAVTAQAAAIQALATAGDSSRNGASQNGAAQGAPVPGSQGGQPPVSPQAGPQQPAPRKRGRPRKVQPPPEAPSAPAPQTPGLAAASAPAPAMLGRYQAIRTEVTRLAEQGMDAAAISEQLSVPRGEVQLILNLMSKKGGA